MAPTSPPRTIPRRRLGTQGLEVSAIGLGCMNFVGVYSYGRNSLGEDDAVALIQHAFHNGVTFFDTSDAYGPLTSEILLGKAIKDLPRDKVQIATKYGYVIEAGRMVGVRADPEYIRERCEASLKRLGVEYIDLYFQHRTDTTVPIEVTVGALKQLVEEGKVKYIGLSEASASTIRRAHAVHPITAIQIEWSLWTRDIEEEIVPVCRELGIGIVPYSPLGRGFFAGKAVVEKLEDGDRRTDVHPRFAASCIDKNKILYERVAALAARHGCTPAQLALAWVLHQGEDVVPIPGTSKISNLDMNLVAAHIKLDAHELAEVTAAVPEAEVAGARANPVMAAKMWHAAETPPLKQ
ncbi:pyridoxine 4-dehydrogenase [Marchantia polymorpha subsp. ruderalis]|uniref:NADP-dependent oxidoreductase domain-containing protein n=2 Tax=Marchantia polymorpha TaxID=3197 RepID=A0AAF6BJ72_MARPO|nr:hypothetical protein MARPO_0117s0007 [Marchantia polymorpha]BBN12056.1 hypothetical protein Mp_5g16990 [Marchantia polymorpha subsp. ruderalis]|eukprot:PTQ30925.1 hypothetical protein MARPO_0117s0007 [Marchantia polymorpha]